MYIRFGYKLFKKNLLISILIILKLSITLIIANTQIAEYNSFSEVFSLTKNFPEKNTYLFSPSPSDNDDIKAINSLFDKYKDKIIVESPAQSIFYDKNNIKHEIIGYGDKTSELLNMRVKGKWYTEETYDDYISCVVSSGYSIGETINLFLSDSHDEKSGELNFKVVGVLKNNSDLLRFNTAGNNPMVEYLFEKSNKDTPAILFNLKELSKFGISAEENTVNNSLVFIKDEYSEEVYDIANDFRDFSWFTSLEAAKAESQLQLSYRMKGILPMVMAILLVGIVSMVCMAIMKIYYNMRQFSVYCICGMKPKASLLICMWYIIIQIAAILLSSSLIFLGLYVNYLSTESIIFNELNIYFTIGILLASGIITFIAPYFLLKNHEPLKTFKESI